MTKTITPSEAKKLKVTVIPPEVIEVFNQLIVENLSGRTATVTQKEAARRIASKMNIPSGEVYNKKYLDVEDVFRGAGWKVEYDKPGYNEDYEATWKFTAPTTRGHDE